MAATSAQAVSGAETDTIGAVENVTGGSGNDTIIGTTANSVLKGGPCVERVAGGSDNDRLVGFEKVEFKGGTQLALASPIVLDLNDDGVTQINQKLSKAQFDK